MTRSLLSSFFPLFHFSLISLNLDLESNSWTLLHASNFLYRRLYEHLFSLCLCLFRIWCHHFSLSPVLFTLLPFHSSSQHHMHRKAQLHVSWQTRLKLTRSFLMRFQHFFCHSLSFSLLFSLSFLRDFVSSFCPLIQLFVSFFLEEKGEFLFFSLASSFLSLSPIIFSPFLFSPFHSPLQRLFPFCPSPLFFPLSPSIWLISLRLQQHKRQHTCLYVAKTWTRYYIANWAEDNEVQCWNWRISDWCPNSPPPNWRCITSCEIWLASESALRWYTSTAQERGPHVSDLLKLVVNYNNTHDTCPNSAFTAYTAGLFHA